MARSKEDIAVSTSPSAAATEMVEAIIKDKRKILPCAAYLQGEYGINGLYVGVPVKLGAGGIQQIVEIKLTPEEKAGLDKSDEFMIQALQKIVDGCKRHKVRPGLHTGSSAYAKRMIAMGFQLVTLMGDARLLTMAGQQIVREMAGAEPTA